MVDTPVGGAVKGDEPPLAPEKGAVPLRRRLDRALDRWAQIFSLALLGAVVFEAVLPVAWLYWQEVAWPYSPAFLAAAAWLVAVVLLAIICEPIRVARRQWSRLFWYPHLWIAVVLAIVLAAALERLPSGLRPFESGPDWQQVVPVVPMGLALVFGIGWWHLKRREPPPHVSSQVEPGRATWAVVETWIRSGEDPIVAEDLDLFRHRAVAARITQLVEQGRHVALLGQFGGGKSSILNLVCHRLDAAPTTMIVARFNAWSVSRPEDVPRSALQRMLSALDQFVDTIQFRSLPSSYQRLASAEPTGRLTGVLGVREEGEPLEELERLTPVLEALNARLVLIVEDVERAGKSFDTRHLQRLLWTLRGVGRATFILAADPTSTRLDFPKLCDEIELIPDLDADDVMVILDASYRHWTSRFKDIDPHPNRDKDSKLQLHQLAEQGELLGFIRRTGRDTPVDALIALLSTPRALKHVLRRVNRAWDALHGEVELDDLIIIAALRHGCEPVFRFLLSNIDAARHKPDDMLPKTKTIKEAFAALIDDQTRGHAAKQLVTLLDIEQLTDGTLAHGRSSPQGVSEASPVDYFRRIVGEHIGPDELRDQVVLADITQWRTGGKSRLVERLTASPTDDTYPRRWEHFSFRHQDDDELIRLITEVASYLLARDEAAARADDPAMLSLWRRGHRRLQLDAHADWLRNRIVEAVPRSLQLANGLLQYWTGERSIVSDDARTNIRTAMVESVRREIVTAEDMRNTLDGSRPYQLTRLVTQTGRDSSVERFAEWSDYLTPIILKGVSTAPDLFLAELANMVGDAESGQTWARDDDQPRFVSEYHFDRRRSETLLGERLNDALELFENYSGENPYVVRTKNEAATWLLARRTESNAPSTSPQ